MTSFLSHHAYAALLISSSASHILYILFNRTSQKYVSTEIYLFNLIWIRNHLASEENEANESLLT
jgi:hypothetical protein